MEIGVGARGERPVARSSQKAHASVGVCVCSVRVGSLQGCHSVQATGGGRPEEETLEIFPSSLKIFPYICANISFLGCHGQPAPAPVSGRRDPQTFGSQAGTPPPQLLLLSLALQFNRPPFKFRGGGGPARSALQLRGLVGLLGPAPLRNPACHW